MSTPPLVHPLLTACGVPHAFGQRAAQPRPDVLRPQQVHGNLVAEVDGLAGLTLSHADAVVSMAVGRPIGVVTADCVPVLAASRSGRAVAAIHAGWKGLASGVIPAAIALLRIRSGGEALVAVVGPHIGPAHYEIDEPVIPELRPRFGTLLDRALTRTRPGHARLDLGQLARIALADAGLAASDTGALSGSCTFSDTRQFHSYRRDGAAAGRLLHHIAALADSPDSHPSLDRGGSRT